MATDTMIEATLEDAALTAMDAAMLASMVDEEAPLPRPKSKRGRKPRLDRSGETPEERTARKTQHQRDRRAAIAKKAKELRTVIRDADTTRQALADAAMVLLQRGGPVADEIECMLAKVFTHQIGAPISIRAECANRSLNPKYLSYPAMSREERLQRLRLI
ncbi:hypothetical protein ACQQ2Q_04775 [Agrobacterium sp. ES01]|uniref:hypothetical protein n=1 Tax=Agrobacterium sp. ES01 TaxID=3420714 RepID=UPI003D144DED